MSPNAPLSPNASLEELLRGAAVDIAWLHEAESRMAAAADPGRVLAMLSPRIHFTIGDAPLTAAVTLDSAHGPIPTGRWSVEDPARLYLILAAMRCAGSGRDDLLKRYFRLCDDREKCSLMRGIALIDADATYKPLALECGRTNSETLFRALALDNPYPASEYTEPEFNQLVLKGLFMAIGIQDVVGLEARANPNLSRMCEDYYDERTAAGRDFPPDIWLAVGPHASERGKALIVDRLDDADGRQRYCAARALSGLARGDAALRARLAERVESEQDERVATLLRESLAAPRDD